MTTEQLIQNAEAALAALHARVGDLPDLMVALDAFDDAAAMMRPEETCEQRRARTYGIEESPHQAHNFYATSGEDR